MEEEKVSENHLTSAAAFVEGGIQEACDDACSICLEDFSDSDPSAVTSCKHEFHLQCILEWCQRSSQCPMCWQSVSLKDPTSQELLDAVEHERNIRMNPPRNTTIFRHPTLGDFELQHLPVNASESELEERIIQHLAAAAAMGRARQLARREGQRNRASTQARNQFLLFSTNQNAQNSTNSDSSSGPISPFISVGEESEQIIARRSSAQNDQIVNAAIGSSASASGNQQLISSSNSGFPTQASPSSQDRAGSSDLQSFSESLKSKFNTLSTRYKESITKSTRGWKDRLFNRVISTPEPTNSESRVEVTDSISTVSRLMDHLEIEENGRDNNVVSNDSGDTSNTNSTENHTLDAGGIRYLNENGTRDPCASSSTINN